MSPRSFFRTVAGRLLLLLIAWLAAGPGARAQQFQWADALFDPAGAGSAWLNAVAYDATDHAYVSIGAIGDVRIGGTLNPAPNGQPRAFLVRYAPDGTVSWVKQGFTALHLVADSVGDVVATGAFSGSLTIGTTTLIAAGTSDYFVARWDAAGNPRWAVQGGGAGDRTPYRLALDPAGDVYLTGQFDGTSGFGAFTLPTTAGTGLGTTSAFVLKLDGGTGAVRWARGTTNVAQSGATSRGLRLGTDAAGNVYVVGAYARGTAVGSRAFPTPPTNAEQLFWLKLSPAGQPLAVRALPLPAPATDPGFAVDANGFGFLTNTFRNAIDLGGVTLTATGGEDTYVARYDPNGVLQWGRRLGGTTPNDLTDATDLALDKQGGVVVAGFLRGRASDGNRAFGTPYDPVTHPDYDAYAAGLDQLTGTLRWARTGGGPADEEGSRLAVAPTGNLALVGRTLSDTARFGAVRVGALGTGGNAKVFVARLLSGHNTLYGRVFLDLNANGAQDPGEGAYPAPLLISVTTNGAPVTTALTQPDGTYEAVVPVGTFNVALAAAPAHYAVMTLGPVGATFTSLGTAQPGPTYALQPVANQPDVQVLLTPLRRARPGMLVPYRLTYRNVGTTTIATGRITLDFEPVLRFHQATPAATRNGQTLTWTYANLPPGGQRDIEVIFSLPTTAPPGDSVRCTARIEPLLTDLVPGDNADVSRRVVTASVDPNAIDVQPAQLTTTQVRGGEWVMYTIYFQNVGTDTAFTVTVRDSLPRGKFNLPTLEFITASHSCLYYVDSTGVIAGVFDDIQLPSHTDNLVRSNGYMRFRVRPLPWLAVGERIRNRAWLYFDYNAPLVTNTATTLITAPTGLPADGAPVAAPPLTAWPNPVTDYLTVTGWLPDAGPLTLRLLDVAGRPARVVRLPHGGLLDTALSVAGLPAGLYLLEARCGTARLSRRVVVE